MECSLTENYNNSRITKMYKKKLNSLLDEIPIYSSLWDDDKAVKKRIKWS